MTIPERLRSTIHTFCTDMWDGYLSAIADFIAAHPEVKAKVVIDRFHVAKNYRDGFDTLRKKELRRLRRELPEATYKEVVYGMHWVLRHNHDNLDEVDKERLRTLFQYVPTLHQAYTLREELTAIFNMGLSLAEGRHRLEKWAVKVERCKWKYGQRAYRYIYLDAGHIAENLALAAASLNRGSCEIGALYDDQVNAIIGIDGIEESVICMAVVGTPA